jgi:hypothetical protein
MEALSCALWHLQPIETYPDQPETGRNNAAGLTCFGYFERYRTYELTVRESYHIKVSTRRYKQAIILRVAVKRQDISLDDGYRC